MCLFPAHYQNWDMNWIRKDKDFIHFLSVNRWKEEAARQLYNRIRNYYFPNLILTPPNDTQSIEECMADVSVISN